jgi:mannose-6-phosphate isomerase-like protein (cupin superfamily)
MWNKELLSMKRKLPYACLVTLGLVVPVFASEPGAPVPAAPGDYVSAAQLAHDLKEAIAGHNDPALATIGVNSRYAIHEVHREKAGPPAVHADATELHFILEGRAIFVTGGRIEKQSTGDVITGGTEHEVKAGDAIIVPMGSPHWYRQIDAPLSYLEVRFVSRVSSADH